MAKNTLHKVKRRTKTGVRTYYVKQDQAGVKLRNMRSDKPKLTAAQKGARIGAVVGAVFGGTAGAVGGGVTGAVVRHNQFSGAVRGANPWLSVGGMAEHHSFMGNVIRNNPSRAAKHYGGGMAAGATVFGAGGAAAGAAAGAGIGHLIGRAIDRKGNRTQSIATKTQGRSRA